MRVLALLSAILCALGGAGCSNLLGLEDPKPDFGGGDGGPRSLLSIAIGPSPLDLPIGFSKQLTATGMFDDGSQDDITSQTEFSAEPGAAITVTPQGLAMGVSEGSAKVTGKLGRISGELTAQISGAVATRLMFAMADVRIARQQGARVRLMAELSDGRMQDASLTATYSSDNQAVANVTVPGRIDAGATDGNATITARLGTATPATINAVVLPKDCQPVINEFQTGGAGSGADEWIELLNPCTVAKDVAGWTLVYRSQMDDDTMDTNVMLALAGSMAPGEIRLYGGVDYTGTKDGTWPGASGIMQQMTGGVALRMGAGNSAIADKVAYGAVILTHPFIEGLMPLDQMANGRSAQRKPFDGHDEDIGKLEFEQVTARTPRAPNFP